MPFRVPLGLPPGVKNCKTAQLSAYDAKEESFCIVSWPLISTVRSKALFFGLFFLGGGRGHFGYPRAGVVAGVKN